MKLEVARHLRFEVVGLAVLICPALELKAGHLGRFGLLGARAVLHRLRGDGRAVFAGIERDGVKRDLGRRERDGELVLLVARVKVKIRIVAVGDVDLDAIGDGVLDGAAVDLLLYAGLKIELSRVGRVALGGGVARRPLDVSTAVVGKVGHEVNERAVGALICAGNLGGCLIEIFASLGITHRDPQGIENRGVDRGDVALVCARIVVRERKRAFGKIEALGRIAATRPLPVVEDVSLLLGRRNIHRGVQVTRDDERSAPRVVERGIAAADAKALLQRVIEHVEALDLVGLDAVVLGPHGDEVDGLVVRDALEHDARVLVVLGRVAVVDLVVDLGAAL